MGASSPMWADMSKYLSKTVSNATYGKLASTVLPRVSAGPASYNYNTNAPVRITPHGVRRLHIFDNHKIPNGLQGKPLYTFKRRIVRERVREGDNTKYNKDVITTLILDDKGLKHQDTIKLKPTEYCLKRLTPAESIIIKQL